MAEALNWIGNIRSMKVKMKRPISQRHLWEYRWPLRLAHTGYEYLPWHLSQPLHIEDGGYLNLIDNVLVNVTDPI